MTALGLEADLKIGVTLFGNTDARQVAVKKAFDMHRQNGAALVENAVQMNASLRQQRRHGFGAAVFAADHFFIAAEAQIDVTLRLEALFQQSLHGFHHADEVVFHIERAAPPDKFAVVMAAERGIGPILFRSGRDRHHVLMRQQRNRL